MAYILDQTSWKFLPDFHKVSAYENVNNSINDKTRWFLFSAEVTYADDTETTIQLDKSHSWIIGIQRNLLQTEITLTKKWRRQSPPL